MSVKDLSGRSHIYHALSLRRSSWCSNSLQMKNGGPNIPEPMVERRCRRVGSSDATLAISTTSVRCNSSSYDNTLMDECIEGGGEQHVMEEFASTKLMLLKAQKDAVYLNIDTIWTKEELQGYQVDSAGLTRHSSQSVSFAGSCFLGVYGLGAAMAFDSLGHPFDHIGGAFIGSLTAAGLCGQCDLVAGKKFTYDMLVLIRENPLKVLWKTKPLMSEFIEMNTYPEAFENTNGKIFFSVTRCFPYFRNEMRDTVIASCWIPPLMGFKPFWLDNSKVGGGWYIDGGFTNNLPMWDERTVTISPFGWYDRASIRPRSYISKLLVEFH